MARIRNLFSFFAIIISTSRYFNRDVSCIRTFFKRRFRYESSIYPRFQSISTDGGNSDPKTFRLDVVARASWNRNKVEGHQQYETEESDPPDHLESEDDDDIEGKTEESDPPDHLEREDDDDVERSPHQQSDPPDQSQSSLPPSSVPSIKDAVASYLAKSIARQERKYHSKGGRRAGRPQGSKAKQDIRLKCDKSAGWD
jgi:RIO kinase 2